MATILLTGVTGAVGQCLVPFLKARGHRLIYLIRPRSNQSILDRLQVVLNGKLDDGDAWWSGDVVLPDAGVQPVDRLFWKRKVDHVLHCAGAISFDSAVADETWRTNVEGTEHMLALAEHLGATSFHHVSTAYVAEMGSATIIYLRPPCPSQMSARD